MHEYIFESSNRCLNRPAEDYSSGICAANFLSNLRDSEHVGSFTDVLTCFEPLNVQSSKHTVKILATGLGLYISECIKILCRHKNIGLTLLTSSIVDDSGLSCQTMTGLLDAD